jgi:hypothetical protein
MGGEAARVGVSAKRQRVEDLVRLGASNVRQGRQGVLGDGPLGKEFEAAYTEWIRERWDNGEIIIRRMWPERP